VVYGTAPGPIPYAKQGCRVLQCTYVYEPRSTERPGAIAVVYGPLLSQYVDETGPVLNVPRRVILLPISSLVNI